MDGQCRNAGFGFPGYNGTLPKALRSSRGRGDCPRKSCDHPKEMDCFELLATVAGQLLHNEDNERVVWTRPATIRKCVKSEAGIVINGSNVGKGDVVNCAGEQGEAIYTTSEELLEGMAQGESLQEKQPKSNPSEACMADRLQKIKFIHGTSAVSDLQHKEAFDPAKHELATLCMTGKPMDTSESTKNNRRDEFNRQLTPLSCHDNPEVIDSNELEKGSLDSRKRNKPDGMKESVKAVVSEKGDLAASIQKDIVAHCCLMDLKGIGAGELDEESVSRFTPKVKGTDLYLQGQDMPDDDNTPLLSSGSSKEAPLFMKQTPCKPRRKKGTRGRPGLSCSKVMDDNDNSSETTAPRTAQSKSSVLSQTRASKSRRHTNHASAQSGLKRKHSSLPAEFVHVTSSPTVLRSASKLSAKEQGEPRVKLNIKSFTVPKLFIELPESATIANLKSAVVEAALNIFGGGISVCMLLQGNKILDETASLLQVGISSAGKPDSLDFMLEPSPLTTAGGKDPILVLSQASIEPSLRYPTFSKRDKAHKSSCNKDTVTSEVLMEIDEHSETIHARPTRYIKDDISMILHDSNKEVIPSSHALILHASNKPPGMPLATSENNSQNPDICKRRIRRPFSVAEVEALVQAVEKLGTGRWRDVKFQAFDQANHRTYVDLKDKWKTLVHTAHIAPHQRRGEPVPQELLDRVMHAHSYWTAHQAMRQADIS